MRAYWSPGAPLALECDDDHLLRGGVPQLPDIVRLWSWVANPVSFRLMSELSLTESFIQHQRQDRFAKLLWVLFLICFGYCISQHACMISISIV